MSSGDGMIGDPPAMPGLQPFVPGPVGVRQFSHKRRAGVAEVAPSGRLRLDSIARWAQDVAWADVVDAGLRDLTIWLVRRTRIRVAQFPRLDETYRMTTYVTGLGRMWAERRTDIVPAEAGVRSGVSVSGEPGASALPPIAEVSCLWVHIDPERLLPTPVHQVEKDMWTGANTPAVKARLQHPPPVDDAVPREWTFRGAELDVAEHVNNAAYFTPFDDELISLTAARPGGDIETADVEIEYRSPSQAGPHGVLAAGPVRWIVDAAGEVNASAVLADWPG